MAVPPVSNGPISHSPRSQHDRTRREDRHFQSSTPGGTTSLRRRGVLRGRAATGKLIATGHHSRPARRFTGEHSRIAGPTRVKGLAP
jgi:hypothetical protein